MKWYVLQFTTTRFAAVFAHLERLSFSYFCPMETERYRRPDKIVSYRERCFPLFPGYLFVQADFEEVHSTIIRGLRANGTKTYVKEIIRCLYLNLELSVPLLKYPLAT